MITDKKYDIYFSCAMHGQSEAMRRENTHFGEALRAVCAQYGWEVFDPELKHNNGGWPQGETYTAEKNILRQCGAMVMVLNGPSTGAGGESVICEYDDVPIILVSAEPDTLSRFLLCNPAVKKIITQRGEAETITEVIAALRELM